MSEQRGRGRVPLPGVGWGIRASGGAKFEVRPVNYSIAGLLFEVIQGEVPPLGERVGLTFRAERLDGPPTRFTVTAEVMRHEQRKGVKLCGVKVIKVKGAGDQRAMDDTWLEQLFASAD
jgi:hypothetical protein